MRCKKITAILTAAALITGLIGCGGTAAGSSTKDGAAAGTEAAAGSGEAVDTGAGAAPAEGLVEVTLPTFLAGENVGGVFFLPQVERFNAKYEGQYKITIEEVPQASYAEKIKQLAQQNKLPVLVHSPGSGGIDTQWFKQVVLANGMAKDLTEFAEKNPEVKANWVPESLEFCTVDGKLICKPISVLKPVGLYYNNTMYKSEKEIKDQSMEEFIAGLGENKLAFQTADNGWTTGLLLTALIAAEEGGTELLSGSADEKLWDYNNPVLISAVEKLKGIMQNNASSNSIGAAYADAANAFMSQSASIICNGSWMAAEFEDKSADKWSNGFEGSQVSATIYPGNVAIVNPRIYGEFWVSANASPEETALAEAFLAFRDSQEEIEALLLAEGGSCPQLTYSETFLEKQKESKVLYELSQSLNDETTYAVAVFDVMPASVADVEFGKLLPKLVDNTLTAEQFCAELTKKAEEAKQ